MMRTQSQLAKRYAKAIFELAEEKQILPALQADMEAIVAVLKVSHTFAEVLSSPVLSVEESKKLLEQFATQARLSTLTQKLFAVLIRNRRVKEMQEIAQAVLDRLEAHHHIVRVQVTSAVALTPEAVRQLEQHLSTALHQTAKVEVAVDTRILGGLIIAVGSKMWDDSIAGKINQVHRAQKQAVAAF